MVPSYYEENEKRFLNLIRGNWGKFKAGQAFIQVRGQSDLTEGRGGMETLGVFFSPTRAYECRANHEGVQGRAKNWPMIDTDIVIHDCPMNLAPEKGNFDGFIKTLPRKHPNSYLKKGTDKEYEEYLRLKAKFS